jgi:hypothetical protein
MITSKESPELEVVIQERELLVRVEAAVEAQKVKIGEVLALLAAKSGKGPYDLGDGKPAGWTIAQRGELWFMIPTKPKKEVL